MFKYNIGGYVFTSVADPSIFDMDPDPAWTSMDPTMLKDQKSSH